MAKKRTAIPQANKVKAELQKEVNSQCPFCENQDVGHFEVHHIDGNPSNHEKSNLLLTCPTCHSKIEKGEIALVEVLKIKIELVTKPRAAHMRLGKIINFNERVKNAVVGDNNKVVINQRRETQRYPPGCIGFDALKSNYISYLIERYQAYKESEVGKSKINYAILPAQIKKQFKVGPSRSVYNIPDERFSEVVQFIQEKISGTWLAKVKGKSHKNFSGFDEYKEKQQSKQIAI